MEAVIWNAASMFISSPTARGLSGRGTGYPRLARRVRDQLRREIGEGDVEYRIPPKSARDNLGHVETVKMPNGRINHRIIIHAKLRKDLPSCTSTRSTRSSMPGACRYSISRISSPRSAGSTGPWAERWPTRFQ